MRKLKAILLAAVAVGALAGLDIVDLWRRILWKQLLYCSCPDMLPSGQPGFTYAVWMSSSETEPVDPEQ
jgi:hypothetical protein